MAEVVIKLDKFKPRPYQLPIIDAIENKGYKRVLAILPRRAGKDITAFNLAIRQCLTKVCVVYYIFPTYSQAKKVIWDSITTDSRRMLEFIPEELIESKNSQEMKIWFKNGSLLQLVGSDSYDSLMGTNPIGCVFSEYALQDPQAFKYLSPILRANGGWACFLSTPRGKGNHLYDLFKLAQQAPNWFCYKLTLDDTKHVALSEIEDERRLGLISEDLIQQEYYTSFDMGVEGSFYSKYIDNLRLKSQLCNVPWNPTYKTHTAWDIGIRDSTVILFYQVIGPAINVIDYYEKNKEGLEHYVQVLQSKPYTYGKHIAPHDIQVREFTSGITRLEKARQLGVKFTVADDVSLMDGIEAVRSNLPRMWIDDVRCSQLIKSLENYRQEYDSKRKVYKGYPLHDNFSHAADAMRYLCVSLNKVKEGSNPDEIDKRYREARYGAEANLPSFFSNDFK